jgi:hypothetical protein
MNEEVENTIIDVMMNELFPESILLIRKERISPLINPKDYAYSFTSFVNYNTQRSLG